MILKLKVEWGARLASSAFWRRLDEHRAPSTLSLYRSTPELIKTKSKLEIAPGEFEDEGWVCVAVQAQ